MDFSSLGFVAYDVLLVLACTVGAIFGSLTQAMMLTISLDGPPREDHEYQRASAHLQEMRGVWLTLRIFIGGVMGFVFGLYFVGTLNETPATFAKIWALSFVVGYAAPKLWQAKETAIVKAAQSETTGN